MKNLSAFFLLIFLASLSAFAESPRFKVLLSVPPEFGDYEKEVASYLRRELREIKDVELVQKNGDFFISVVPAPVDLESGRAGVAVSFVFQHDSNTIHSVNMGPQSNLKQICQKIIAQFDSILLEPIRN